MLRLEANGSTGEGVVAVKGFLSEEPRVGWVDAGGARLLPAPFPQCSQRGRAPAPAPLMSTQAEETPGPLPNVPKTGWEGGQAEEFREFFFFNP